MSESVPNQDKVTGAFLPGNKLAEGKRSRHQAAYLRGLILDEMTEDDIKAIIRTTIDAAKNGDKDARRDLWDRIGGKPAQAVEVSGSDSGPIEFVWSVAKKEEAPSG